MKAVYTQAKLNEYNDEDLLKYIGFLFEELKSLDERMKNDDTIAKLVEELKEYKAQHYGDNKKLYKGHLKAARIVAGARGLKFQVPAIFANGDDE